jgi:hypothetical protein
MHPREPRTWPPHSFAARTISVARARSWDSFVREARAGSFAQSTRWAPVERCDSWLEKREPSFFWCECRGKLALAGLGVRRDFPCSPFADYEFDRGPVFDDPAVFEAWLEATLPRLRHDAVRIRLMPRWRLDEGGDDIETILERQGFVRRRREGDWATLLVDLTVGEDELLQSFRRQTRQSIKKGACAGVTVDEEAGQAACAIMAGLYADLAARTSMHPLSLAWFERLWREWLAGGGGAVLVARDGHGPRAAAVVVHYADVAHLYVMASRDVDRPISSTSLLVWGVARWARRRGCRTLDLGGYSLMTRPGEGLAGVNQFKRGFAPTIEPTRYVALHEMVVRPRLADLVTEARKADLLRRRQASCSRAPKQQTSDD